MIMNIKQFNDRKAIAAVPNTASSTPMAEDSQIHISKNILFR